MGIPLFCVKGIPCLTMLLYKEYAKMHITYKSPEMPYFTLYFDLIYIGLSFPKMPFFILREFPSYDVSQGLVGKPII